MMERRKDGQSKISIPPKLHLCGYKEQGTKRTVNLASHIHTQAKAKLANPSALVRFP